MDDKIFDLLEKMYIQMQDMRENMATKRELQDLRENVATKQELQDLRENMATKRELQDLRENVATKQELQDLRDNMATKQDIVRLENKMDTNFKALYDGYKQSVEGINEIRHRLDALTYKVENQEIKLQVLKSVK